MKNSSLYLPGFHLSTLRRKPRSLPQKLADGLAKIQHHSVGVACSMLKDDAETALIEINMDPSWHWSAFVKARLQTPGVFANFLTSPFHRNLVGDPRYALFVDKIGLLEAWETMPSEYGGPPESSLSTEITD